MYYVYVLTIGNVNYIGRTYDICIRFKQHVQMLRGDRHTNKALQDEYNLYGISKLSFKVQEECETESQSMQLEQLLIRSTNNVNVIKDTNRIFYKKQWSTRSISDSLGNVFQSAKAASIQYGCSVTSIRKCCDGEHNKLSNGVVVWYTDVGKPLEQPKGVAIPSQPVQCSDGSVYPSINKCAEHYRCKSSIISKICRGEKSSFKGLTFKFL